MAQLEIVKAESSIESTHGGARPGAGRKPKALRYASELAQAEEKIMSALPAAIDSLVASAACGDVAAAKYLLDRAFGRVQVQAAPLAEDTAIPFDESDLKREQGKKEWRDSTGAW
jgi:hypothetical protein